MTTTIEKLVRLALILVVGSVLFVDVQRPIERGDEAIHVRVMQEMFQSGDVLSPTFYGEPYFNKPPLKMWLGLVPVAIFGEHQITYRALDIALGITLLLALWMTATHVSRTPWGGHTAVIAMLSARILFDGHGMTAAVQDTALTLVTTLAILTWWYDRSHRRWWLIGALVGIGFFVKWIAGLYALIVIGILTLLSSSERQALPRELLSRALPILVGLSPALLFALWHHLSSPQGFVDAVSFNIGHRLFGEGIHHRENPWLYFQVLQGERGFPPGVLTLIAALIALGPALRDERHPARLLLVWSFLPPLLFSTLSSRLEWYILPSLPGVALLISWATVTAGRVALSSTPKVWPRLVAGMLSLAMVATVSSEAAIQIRKLLSPPQPFPIFTLIDDLRRETTAPCCLNEGSTTPLLDCPVAFIESDPTMLPEQIVSRREAVHLGFLNPKRCHLTRGAIPTFSPPTIITSQEVLKELPAWSTHYEWSTLPLLGSDRKSSRPLVVGRCRERMLGCTL